MQKLLVVVVIADDGPSVSKAEQLRVVLLCVVRGYLFHIMRFGPVGVAALEAKGMNPQMLSSAENELAAPMPSHNTMSNEDFELALKARQVGDEVSFA